MLKLSSLAGVVLLALSASTAQAQPRPKSAAAQAGDRIVLPADATPDRYDISVTPDAQHMTFAGSVRIGLNVRRTTRRIVLNAADLSFARVALSGRPEAPKVSFDKAHETAALAFSRPVTPGRYTLSIDYSGKINAHAAGLFWLDYTGADGKRERALFTQFENSDARRFTPSWDEPAQKAVFSLTATVPADQMAISNMPVASSQALAGGMKRVRFADTPKMSSYLLFFGLGDLERVSRKVGGTDVGVIVKRGDLQRGAFALDAAVQLLPYYNDYFGVKYPLPKLDLIAGPGRSQFFGAMENWGAIFFFEQDMLIDSKISTQADRQNVYVTIAHEMAHQWFGDLVTMGWWDDLWLNEGFASWMEVKASDHFHPEWNLWLGQLGDKETAMRLDARAGTHPIIQPIHDVLQANQAFDTITYQKGQSVIRMLEAYVGQDAWRTGVRSYIRKHAYANTVTDDLWREMDGASKAGPISGIAHDFTLQAGVPLIRVEDTQCAGDRAGGRIELDQAQFAVDGKPTPSRRWSVPAIVQGVNDAKRSLIIREGRAQAKANCPPAIVNAGQTGYFRTQYAASEMAALTTGFPRLSAYDQLGLINDAWALGEAGGEPVGDFLTLASRLPADANPVVWSELLGFLNQIDGLYYGLPEQSAYRAFARKLLAPLFARVGWDPRPGEASNISLLRGDLLTTLAVVDDPAVVAEARRRFAAYLANPEGLSAGTRRAMLRIVARQADAPTWEQLHQLARRAPTPLEKTELYDLLGSARSPDLARRTLELALSGEPEKTIGPTIVAAVSTPFPELAFDYATAHIDRINEALEPDSRNQYVPSLVSNSSDPRVIDKLNAYAATHIPATARSSVVKSASNIAYRARVRRETLPQISQWIALHGG